MINDVYTNKKVLSEMERFFTENGFIQLSDFVGESGTISIYNAFGQLMTERSEDEISEVALRFSTSNFECGF